MKTLFLSSVALMGLATSAMAMSPSVSSFLPEQSGSSAILVAQESLPNSGTVGEIIHAAPYTYLQAMKDGKGTWLAIPYRDIPVGAEISYADGAAMRDFHSGSLDRTFKEVLFLGGVVVAGESPAEAVPGHPPVPTLPSGHAPVAGLPSGHVPVPAAPADLPNSGKVSAVIQAGDYTYLDVVDDGVETWLAIPRRDILVGAMVRYGDGMPMKDFHSASLDRTFKEVFFLGGVELAEN
ncbi:MAG: hypothetical protein OEZ03_07320 [Alphaproteobacteria bacterium]|nr:hypothetical protein [Alphaproteobacteria bacterium]